VEGLVTWDGSCAADKAGNSMATLSNGWAPVFVGESSCAIALDWSPGCGLPDSCQTTIRYGLSWIPAEDHPAYEDRVAGEVYASGDCEEAGGAWRRELSNGWLPHYSAAGCPMTFAWEQCGGLYTNPIIPEDCPDPGVLRLEGRDLLVCTGGDSGGAFPLWEGSALMGWERRGWLFSPAPAWSSDSYWAPELHSLGEGEGYAAVYTARAADSGQLSIGLATSGSPEGPWTDLGEPLLSDPGMGLIDPHLSLDEEGQPWLIYKEDGNALGLPTSILAQALDAALRPRGAPIELIRNDLDWEGHVIEAPWILRREGSWFLFYSGEAYDSARYALGVARASALTGPYEKAAAPILQSRGAWSGAGHASIVAGADGDIIVYHAWVAGAEGAWPGRMTLLDPIQWEDGWPLSRGSPSSGDRPGAD
jgi:beta-xylosidase